MAHPMLQAVRNAAYSSLCDSVQAGKTVALTGINETLAVVMASALAEDQGLRVMLVSSNDLRAVHAGDDAQQLIGGRAATLVGGEIDLTRGASGQESAWRRLDTLARIARSDVGLLCTSADALQQQMGDPSLFRAGQTEIRVGDTLSPDELLNRLIRLGYERVDLVEGKGQCARRGDLLDVYPPDASHAWRIEYFGDEVDGIRSFDAISQRSLENSLSALISPACEALLDEKECGRAAERMRAAVRGMMEHSGMTDLFADLPPIPEDDDELVSYYDANIAPKARERDRSATRLAEMDRRTNALLADAESAALGIPFRRQRFWLPVLTGGRFSLADWYRPQVIFFCEPDQLRERFRERTAGFQQDLTAAIERGEAVQMQERLLMNWEDALSLFEKTSVVACTELLRGLGGLKPEKVLNLEAVTLAGYGSQLRTLADDIRQWHEKTWRVALLSGGVARGQRLAASLAEAGVNAEFDEKLRRSMQPGETLVWPVTLTHGFIWPEAGLAVVSDTDIWGSGYRRSRSRRNTGEKIHAFTDLHQGDYVVHEDHGVGIYQGTVRLMQGGAWRDYLLIQYDGSDKLYVPVEQFQRVQKYIGNPAQPPRLNKIGGGEWKRQKGRVKESLRKIAFDLTALYARRANTPGHAFSKETPWQREFEDQFPFELTPDQEQSVREIVHDMEEPRNMDRLLIGDVGYGKTEVSLRAAFKAVMDGMQVAILAPTTILAQQHFNTVQRRFAGFAARVEVLSRFRTPKEQKEIIANLAAGKIDILVGTHRILAKDVKFRNLGLLIVDEEQRFGVQHKEIIKNLKTQMDVLTLSATPIPRTLHMSMIGIRDMSVLETPPEDRVPVQTHVVEYSDALVRDAILREISRGGQVYFLYNRVQSIERFYQRLRALVPEARIGVAHGQMPEHGLEDVMMDFYAGSYDVLLCTTIIESGLDIPTANTLIVFDAERFGLSQLYQLRGRVGRSTRQAYAYFTVRPDKMLTETAEQRLNAIREFTEFGAGFRIAMRDLEIRGAGNILGPEQHGHLSTVGYEMYCKLMEEAMADAQGIPDRSELETRVDLRVDAFLPQEYVAEEKLRLEIYRRIADLRTEADREDIIDELLDRFGPIPPSVETLLDVSQLRAILNQLGVSQVRRTEQGLLLKVDSRYVPDPMLLLRAMKETDPRLSIPPRPINTILLSGTWISDDEAMRESLPIFRKLAARVESLTQEAAVSAGEDAGT
ncbi:MAG: transcription-repair coupling factor [Clostridia bacterium]|nr:transcription-repair coupling factor [Clostridia bacterium]